VFDICVFLAVCLYSRNVMMHSADCCIAYTLHLPMLWHQRRTVVHHMSQPGAQLGFAGSTDTFCGSDYGQDTSSSNSISDGTALCKLQWQSS
jgi:hypothetical protein